MKSNSTFYNYDIFFKKVLVFSNPKQFFLILIILGLPLIGYAQKDKDIIPTIDCIKYTGNGIYQASFGYENPTKKEVVIDENGSVIKSNNGKRVAKGLNKFNPGKNTKVFTKEFSANDYIVWEIISNGNPHEIVVNANAPKCEPGDGFLFGVIGNGKSGDIIGQELSAMCDNVVGDVPSNLIFQIKDEKVLVEIVPIAGKMNAVINLLTGTPFSIPNVDFLLFKNDLSADLAGLSAIDVYIATDLMCLLNNYTLLINFARPVYPSMTHAFGDGNTGGAVSQGDATQTTDIVRESFKLIDAEGNVLPVDGTGITIGVMSNSYDTQPFTEGNDSKATLDVKEGDLPGLENEHGYTDKVNVIKEYPYGVASDEGRAMMHIIHDVAPGAKLAFHTGSLSPRNFEVGFNTLAEESDIIVDDITFITEPFFGGGKISEAINTFTDNGGLHFTSAGNFADHGYKSTFAASSNVPTTNFIDQGSETRAHLFDGPGGSDYLQKISVVPGTYMIVLQWREDAASQDNLDGALEDLDIYIVDDFGRLLVGSNRVNIAGDPTEVIVFKSTGTGEANILITSANGATTVPFRYIAFQSNGLTWEYDTPGTSTVSGHAMNENSVTVGAIRFNQTIPETFSSFGGTLPDDSPLVDFAAPDGVDTNVNSIGIKYFSNGAPTDGTDYPNFFGTSAAAPSAAAAVALLQSALPTWYPSGKIDEDPIDVIQLFKDNVRDGSSSNEQAGAGMIDANKVFNSLAAQTGRITSFVFDPVTDSENASITTVTIKIIGEFLPVLDSGDTYDPNLDSGDDNKPVVYLDGVAIAYTVGNDGEILATIPPFSGNPNLQVYTAPKEGSEPKSNGGFSEPYPFFQDGKNVLTVTANPVTVKFGQKYKSKMRYTVDGIELPEDETSYATVLSNFGFPDVVFSTIVDDKDYPDVGNNSITPSFDFTDSDSDGLNDNFIDSDGDGVFNVYDQCPNDAGTEANNGCPDTDDDGVVNLYDQCPATPQGETVDENGCSDAQKGVPDFTPATTSSPATTYKVNFIAGNLAIEKNYLTIKPADQEETYGADIANDFIYQITDAYGVAILQADLELMYADIDDLYTVISAFHKLDFNSNYTSSLIFNDFKALINDWDWASETNDFKALINTWKALINDVDDPTNGSDQNFNMILEGSSWSSTENTFKALINSSDNINLDPFHFTSYSTHLNDFKPLINDFKPLINDFKALINRSEFAGDIYLNDFKPLINDFKPLINDFKALINDSSALFTVVSTDDSPSADSPDNAISKFYAVNLLTGIHVYEEPHYILPGSLLNAIEANFEITYDPGKLTITPAILTAKTVNMEIEYGETLTAADLTSDFTGLVNDDLLREVFSNTIPYYFIKLNDDGSETETELELNQLKERGDYAIKIRTPQNYTIEYNNDVDHGKLTIAESLLTFNPTAEPVTYGETPVILPNFGVFVYEDDSAVLYNTDGEIPYYFVKVGGDGTEYTIGGAAKMDVGTYDIFITDVDDNYSIVYAEGRGQLTVEPATLTVTTTAFSVEYGDSVSAVINTSVTGFAFDDENVSTVFTDGTIPYLFVKGSDEGLNIDTVTELGDYIVVVEAPDSGNYVIEYANEHGDLNITEAKLTFSDISKTIQYGGSFNITPNFVGFAEEEGVSNLNNAAYYFMQGEVRYEVGDKMDLGVYDIFITDDATDNYTFDPSNNLGTLTINKATLYVTISDKLFVNQGDTPAITAEFTGFVNEEVVNDVFPSGVPYEFEDEYGDRFYDTSVPGVFTVRITDPTNYEMAYTSDATLFVNPFNDEIKKVRTYADCVSNNNDGTYTVTYHYENDNVDPVYVAIGADNNLSGPAAATATGALPSIFMAGSGTFEIGFNGEQLVWSLTTYEGTHKSSVSSASTSGANVCDAKLDGAYTIAPNPVVGELTITQTIVETSWVYVYNMSGIIVRGANPEYKFDGTIDTVTIDMYNLRSGSLYVVRIQSENGDVRSYNIIKQ